MITQPDPILAELSKPLLALIEDQLSNNESDSNDDLYAYFVANGLTPVQAERALAYRDLYLCNLYLQGATPISGGAVARFDPDSGRFEPA